MLPRRSGETEWIRSRQAGRAHQSHRTHSAKTVATASAPTATQLSERLTKRRQIGWSWDSGATQRRSLTRWRICHHHWPDSPRHLPVSNQADSAFHPFGVDKWVEAAIRCPPHQYVEAPSGEHKRQALVAHLNVARRTKTTNERVSSSLPVLFALLFFYANAVRNLPIANTLRVICSHKVVTILKWPSTVTQCHWQCHGSIERIWFPIIVP